MTNWRKHTDYRVYLVTDRDLCLGRPLEDVVLSAVRGGSRSRSASGKARLVPGLS